MYAWSPSGHRFPWEIFPEEDTWHPEVERRFYGWKLAKTPPKPMDKFVFLQTIAIVGQWSRDRIVARRGYLPHFMDFV